MAETPPPAAKKTAAAKTQYAGPFTVFNSVIDIGFWHRFSSIKLDILKTDDSPVPITGFFAPCSSSGISNPFTLLEESFADDPRDARRARGNRNRCPVPGTLYNTNTWEDFEALDKGSLLKMEAKKILEDILSGRVDEDCALLLRFIVLSFADLKKHFFRYLIGFPALFLCPEGSLIRIKWIKSASKAFTKEEEKSVSAACNKWRSSSSTSEIPFFIVSIGANSHATIKPLKDWQVSQVSGQKLLFGFYDPSHYPNKPGWPLQNFLTFIGLRWNMEIIHFFCYREKRGFADLELSLVGEALVSVPQGWREPQFVPEATGWKRNNDGSLFTHIDLTSSMDPESLANSAADLNLKLMKWRALPSLNLDVLYNVKCLVLGAGALGCQVARMLMAWGVRRITLVDNGLVSLSNPLRQSLYTFDDSLNGGDLKAVAAARRLKAIFPAVEAEGIALEIPMPGCHVPSQNEARVLEDCKHLQTLIISHDVIFLMTDKRESRWLPTLLCASENKIAITAALGFDDYIVMRHGAGPTMSNPDITSESTTVVEDISAVIAQVDSLSMVEEDSRQRIGCCFCNVVAPMDSAPSPKLDQQCSSSRPGLAPIASALAVELMVGILHHPDGINARGEVANSINSSGEQPLGVLPHQIRGSLPQLSQLTVSGYSSDNCIACCSAVVSEHRRRGMEFVLQAISLPTRFENVARLGEVMKVASDDGTDTDIVASKDPISVATGGEESNSDRSAPRCLNLAGTMDPKRLVEYANDVNLSLMNQRLPSLNLSSLSTVKCLLLGAGTLGCQVARMLMAWGVRKITLLDNGKVAMSNPVRQSLYTFEDSNGAALKAIAAARSLKQIIPSVEAEGIELAIPMPGHPIPSEQEASVLKDCERLETLIGSHDVIFLLTDTRESRWLPSLLCASENKIAINAALGFDSYVVMRHGAGPVLSYLETSASESEVGDRDRARRLGCYFCNDVVAPVDSITHRTLDQQCTVTRPGLAPIAAALAVELMAGILHHPNGIHAPGEIVNKRTSIDNRPLGILPHQIRGSLSNYSQLTLIGHSSNNCTACCPTVVSEFKKRRTEFLAHAINHPTYLEDLTGLTELKKLADSFDVEWDDETDVVDEDVQLL